MDDLNDLYQQVILDHSRNPRHFGKLPEATHSAQGRNPLCGDELTLYLKINDGRVEAVSFEGSGCAISRASASLLTETLQGRPVEEVRGLFEEMHKLVTHGRSEKPLPEKLAVFAGVHKFPSRVKCAILPWHTALAALDNRKEPITTE
ncbi:MAG: SUF system NifU family Fe-S cluster assembly protein [Verrucomicrobia bacterium]|nr:SUF system NifU family Fe-S cluster assembly protein [Verrucomicrobiota bacterium]